jgi:hypothetical protein
MLRNLNIVTDLKPTYFWDVDIDKLDVKKSRRLIIERVFGFGTADEIMHISNFYGTKEVLSVLKKLNYIDPKTLNFIAKFFNESVETFKCYTRKQLKIQHWNS